MEVIIQNTTNNVPKINIQSFIIKIWGMKIMSNIDCIEFKKEKVGSIPPPKQVIQDYIIEDLGGWTLQNLQFSKTAGISIIPNYDASGTLHNHLFISQGKIKIKPTDDKLKEISEKLKKEVVSFQVGVVAKHYYGPPGQPIITAYDPKDQIVHSAKGTQMQGVSENLLLMGEEISYIIIQGVEVKIEKICFFYV